MSKSLTRWPLEKADLWMGKYLGLLYPHAQLVVAVGSVRRRKATVADLEVLIIPAAGEITDLFGGATTNSLDENIRSLSEQTGGKLLMNGPQIKKIQTVEGPVLEIYVTTPERWGVEMVIKTGDADFSHKCVMPRKWGGYLPSDTKITNGWQVVRNERVLPMPEESDFLRFLGFPGDLNPSLRTGAQQPELAGQL